MKIQKFTKKPVTIEAVFYDGTKECNRFIVDWARGSGTPATMDEDHEDLRRLSIATLEGAHFVSINDWVIKGVAGEFYPCKPDIFAKTYHHAETGAVKTTTD